MSDEVRKWESLTWLWCLIAAAMVVACLSVGIREFWIAKDGRDKFPEASNPVNPKSGEGPFQHALTAQQALAIAKDAVRAREAWYNEAEFLPLSISSDGSSRVGAYRRSRGKDPRPGESVKIEIDKDGRVVRYRYAPD
jgi:hypothetical protein